MRVVRLYSRPGCHLCDEARALILAERDRTAFVFEEVDVSTGEDLEREYGTRIPVVEVDGAEVAEISLDPDEFAAVVRA
ncbi:MAG TPA: glutaredoxin family protein [Actinomycetota bacterium]|nr:glutaredoxin family protein [Actinomycetota bacterium]